MVVQDTAWLVNKREAVGEQGMVAAMHPLATAAGLEILKAGGNAVDAAVATGFATSVVEPFMSGVGGLCSMVIYRASDNTTAVVDGSALTPGGARDGMYELLDPSRRAGLYQWRATRDDANNTGYRSICVPGTPAALLLALERYGSLPRARVMEPGIRLAEEGYPLDWYVAMMIAFRPDYLQRFPGTARVFFKPDGRPFKPAIMGEGPEKLVQSDLARTLRLVAEQGPRVLYEGEIADKIVSAMHEKGGIITREDLSSYEARELGPGLEASYRGVRLVGASKASGCSTVYQTLNILENFDLAAEGAGTAGAYHLIAEASRRSFLDRFAYMADPDSAPVPWEGLLSKEYAREVARTIDPHRASTDAKAGDPWAYEPGGRAATWRPGGEGEGQTTHITVVDRERNMVALTSTLVADFGSKVVIPGTGILMNNGMAWFNPEPGTVNSVGPRKRALWAISPTLAFRDGRPLLACGSPGGRKVMTAITQTLVNSIDFDEGPQEAVSRPRVHCEGAMTMADSRIESEVIESLGAMGHQLDVREETFTTSLFGRPNCIRIYPERGELRGGVNQHKVAWAMGM